MRRPPSHATACNTLRKLQQPAKYYNRLHGIWLNQRRQEAPGESVLYCVAVCNMDGNHWAMQHTCQSSLDAMQSEMMLQT